MAYTKIHQIKSTLNKALAYIENPKKTDGQMLVSGFNVAPLMATAEFEMTAALAREIKGDYRKTGGTNVLAHHMIQSFSPKDNITPEQAHEIGKKLANEFTGGKFEYVISTHIDKKDHIHNHIIINAVSYVDFKKIRTNKKTVAQIRGISDRICNENKLSVIAEQKENGKSYKEYLESKKGTSWKGELLKKLNFALLVCNNTDEFLSCTEALGVTVDATGKHIKYKEEQQQRFTRGNKLSKTGKFEKESIYSQLSENGAHFKIITRAIKNAVINSTSYEQFIFILENDYDISIKKYKDGIPIYAYENEDISFSIKETNLNKAFSTEKIKRCIIDKDYTFSEQTTDYVAAYENSVYQKVPPTKIVLYDDNIVKITDEGITLELPSADDKPPFKVYMDKRSVYFDETLQKFKAEIGSNFEYQIAYSNDDKEYSNLSAINGEKLLRHIENINNVAPVEVELTAINIIHLTNKGVTISLPEQGITSLFIEKEQLIYDIINQKCTAKIHQNWKYNYTDTDEKPMFIIGDKLLSALNSSKVDVNNMSIANRLLYAERKSALDDIKTLVAAISLMEKDSMSTVLEFKQQEAALSVKIEDLSANRNSVANKIANYAVAAKYLIARKQLVPIIEEYKAKSTFNKRKYFNEHKDEIEKYQYCEEQLTKLGLRVDIDTDKITQLIKNYQDKERELAKENSQLNTELERLRKARETVENIDNNIEKQTQSKKQKK